MNFSRSWIRKVLSTRFLHPQNEFCTYQYLWNIRGHQNPVVAPPALVPALSWSPLSDPLPWRWSTALGPQALDAIYATQIPDVTLHGHTALYVDGQGELVEEMYWMPPRSRWRYWSLQDLLSCRFSNARDVCDDSVTSLIYPESTNPFHFIFDGLLRLFFIFRETVEIDCHHVLVRNSMPQWQREALNWLLPDLKVLEVASPPSILCRKFLTQAPARRGFAYHPDPIHWLRERAWNFLESEPTESKNAFPTKIYLARGSVSGRALINEKKVLLLAERYGYKTIALEDYSFKEQVQIMANATHVMGPHGAAFAFSLFSKNVAILEMFGDCFSPFYAALARSCGHEYIALHHDDGGRRVMSRADYEVDLSKLEVALEYQCGIPQVTRQTP